MDKYLTKEAVDKFRELSENAWLQDPPIIEDYVAYIRHCLGLEECEKLGNGGVPYFK